MPICISLQAKSGANSRRMSYIHLFPPLQSYAGYTPLLLHSVYETFPFLCNLRIIATISQEKCCYFAQDAFHNCRCTVILFPCFYACYDCNPAQVLPLTRLAFSSQNRCSSLFIFQLPIAQAISFVSLGRSSYMGCNFTQDNARFHSLPYCCNRPQVAIASSFRLQFPAGNRCLFHRTRLSNCAGSTLLLK